MNKWINENNSWHPDNKNLGLFGQIFKRQYHTTTKNTDPGAVVSLLTSYVPLGTLHSFKP